MSKKILVISTCQYKLHEDEFVKPITDIIKRSKHDYEIVNYKDVNPKLIVNYSKIIISGTALKDFDYISHIEKFSWLKNTKKQVLGICAGCQIMGLAFGEKLKSGTEIGLKKIEILQEDKILANANLSETYMLHKSYIETPKGFELIAQTQYPQIIKKKTHYGFLFHIEVRNKEIIENFLKLN